MPTPIRRVKRREPIRAVVEGTNAEGTDASRPSSPPPTPSKLREPALPQLLATGTPPATPTKKRQYDAALGEGEHHPFSTPVKRGLLFTPPATPTAFSMGKALFQRGSSKREVVGREAERKILETFLQSSVTGHKGGALYVSGLPGTGKTALVTDLLESKIKKGRVANINCMIIDRPDMIFALMAKEYGYLPRESGLDRDHSIELLTSKFENTNHVLVLDEMDHLMTRDQEVLFKLFEWACTGSYNLTLIGIANAIDLTDRFLPRLQAHKLVPHVLAFKPYTANDVVRIIESRLRDMRPEDEELPLIHPAAVRLCATKTAANSGDLRKAFDICKRAIEVEEEAWRATHAEPLYDITRAPRVSIQVIAKVCQEAFGGVNSLSRLRALNFQQKALLCVLALTEKQAHQANHTVTQIFEQYNHRCERSSALSALHYPEFVQVVAALEAAGVVNVTGVCSRKGLGSTSSGRGSRGGGGAASFRGTEGHKEDYGQRKISCKVLMMDVVTALSDIEPLKALLLASMN